MLLIERRDEGIVEDPSTGREQSVLPCHGYASIVVAKGRGAQPLYHTGAFVFLL